MSRESLLDEAIVKAKEAEDWQLVEWLRMARGGESAARWYTEKLRETQAENAKLREQIDAAHMSRLLTENENESLRELVTDLWEYIYIGTSQDGQSLHDRTRELGVEVP